MPFFFIFLGELFLLFSLSGVVTTELSRLFYNITASRKLSIILLAIIFFPGTLIHELSHFFAAKILLVPTGRLALLPKIERNAVKLGSLEIAKKDPMRLFLIGIAPFIIGTALLLTLIAISLAHNLVHNLQLLIIFVYSIFVIGNTMFSSKKDMEDAWRLLIPVVVIALCMYLFGIPVKAPNISSADYINYFDLMKSSALLLPIPIALDTIVIIVAKALNLLVGRRPSGYSL